MAKKAKKAKAKTKSAKKAVKKAAASGLKIKKVIAIEDRQPPAPPSFYVVATVQVPSPGYTATLKKAVPQGIIATILILNVVTKKKPGIWPPKITEVDARYDIKNYKGKFKQVNVFYGKEKRIAKVETVV
jgi:hypothetical protein